MQMWSEITSKSVFGKTPLHLPPLSLYSPLHFVLSSFFSNMKLEKVESTLPLSLIPPSAFNLISSLCFAPSVVFLLNQLISLWFTRLGVLTRTRHSLESNIYTYCPPNRSHHTLCHFFYFFRGAQSAFLRPLCVLFLAHWLVVFCLKWQTQSVEFQ